MTGLVSSFLIGWGAASAWAGTVTDVDGDEVTVAADAKVVTLGGTLTEIVYGLGAADRLVGVDASSVYPEAATEQPQVGYYRQVGAEGILSLAPDVVLASEEAGPPAALALVEQAGVPVVRLTAEPSLDAAVKRIEAVGSLLDHSTEAAELVASLRADLQAVQPPGTPPPVAFVFGRGAGSLVVAGTDTAAEAMIELAGGAPAVTGYTGYKPLTPEALVAASPDVIVSTTRVVEGLGGVEALTALPAVAATPAAAAGRVVVVEDLMFLGFGPRTGEGARALNEALRR